MFSWFRKQIEEQSVQREILSYKGFEVGQIVWHKVTGQKAVIIRFDPDDDNDVEVSRGWNYSDEFHTTAAEITGIDPMKEVANNEAT